MAARFALRGLAAAAAAVIYYNSFSLTTLDDGTYSVPVEVDSIDVNLLVDSASGGLLVKCSALSSNGTCTRKPSGSAYNISFPRINRSVLVQSTSLEVQLGGTTKFPSFGVFIVFDELPELDDSVQGIFGLARRGPPNAFGSMWAASLYESREVTAVGIQLTYDGTPYFHINGLSSYTNNQRGIEEKETIGGVPRASCVQLKLAGLANDTSNDVCGPESYNVSFASASPTIQLLPTVVTALETQIASTCTAVKNNASVIQHFLCTTRVGLPTFVVDFESYRFSVDPAEYTTRVGGNRPIKVLIGSLPSNAGFQLVLGIPFVRKYPISFSETSVGSNTDKTEVYCALKFTCWSLLALKNGNSKDVDTSPAKSDSDSSVYTVIGIVGGLFVLGICICAIGMGGQSTNTENKENDATVELPVLKKPTDDTNENGANNANESTPLPSAPTMDHANGPESSDLSDYASDSSEEFYEFREYRRRLQERRRLKRESKQMKRGKSRKSSKSKDTQDNYEAVRSP